jgi:hypothetical protein
VEQCQEGAVRLEYVLDSFHQRANQFLGQVVRDGPGEDRVKMAWGIGQVLGEELPYVNALRAVFMTRQKGRIPRGAENVFVIDAHIAAGKKRDVGWRRGT